MDLMWGCDTYIHTQCPGGLNIWVGGGGAVAGNVLTRRGGDVRVATCTVKIRSQMWTHVSDIITSQMYYTIFEVVPLDCAIFTVVPLDCTICAVDPRCTVPSLELCHQTVPSLQLIPDVLYHLCICGTRLYHLHSLSQMYRTIFTVGPKCTVPSLQLCCQNVLSLQLVPDVRYHLRRCAARLYHLYSWFQMYCTIFTVGPRCTVPS